MAMMMRKIPIGTGVTARPRIRPRSILHAAFILLIIATPARSGAGTDEPGFELSGRWSLHSGIWQTGGTLVLRERSPRLAALRLELPRRAGLPAAQYLAKDGEVLLLWTEPSSARPLLQSEDPLMTPFGRLPAAAWRALLTGVDLERFLQSGELGGWPARFHGKGGRRRSLTWESPEGSIDISWRTLPAARKTLVRIEMADRPTLRITLRDARARQMGPGGWIFYDQ